MNATTKKTVVAKTIPKKIMGYLKFAHFIITHPETDILHTLFLDKSIEQIVTTVNDIVVNGDQDKIIIDLRKQFFLPEPKVKTKIKTKTNADLIVHDLVTLARTDTAPETIKAKKTRTKKHVDVAETVVVEEKPVIVAETVVVEEKPVIVKPKKQRAKKTDVDYSPECPSTAFLLTPLDESGEETVVAETVVVENTRSKKNRKNM